LIDGFFMTGRERIDKLMVQRQLAGSRERARALIMAGRVLVDDQPVDKAGAQVDQEASIRLKGEDIPYVSRGGLKLARALETFQVTAAGRTALDVGASTGGFTDCLLQEGARKVFAIDVGYGQLAWKLRHDQRVINLERTNIRYLTADQLDETPDLAVIDASFISLEKVLPSTTALVKPGSDIIALIKPQFEVGKGQVGKGGVVRDPDQHAQVIEKIKLIAAQAGCQVMQLCESPILGTKGNREFLMHLRTGRS
jgi:23S rRNA (cytidine1920-2'-O)/16S rRNA (cytidine1409-2'-O)-methyltransferase